MNTNSSTTPCGTDDAAFADRFAWCIDSTAKQGDLLGALAELLVDLVEQERADKEVSQVDFQDSHGAA